MAYDPAGPGAPLIPGAAVLADADRALSTLVLAGVVAALVPAVGAWQVVSRRRAMRQPPRTLDAGRGPDPLGADGPLLGGDRDRAAALGPAARRTVALATIATHEGPAHEGGRSSTSIQPPARQ